MIARPGVLLDSNIVIYSTQPAHVPLRGFVKASNPAVSAVTYVEVLGFHRLSDSERSALEEFFAAALILPIDWPVIQRAVALRQQRRMSLGDSFVAATALTHNFTLVTHNTSDFRWIPDLQVLDPLEASADSGGPTDAGVAGP